MFVPVVILDVSRVQIGHVSSSQVRKPQNTPTTSSSTPKAKIFDKGCRFCFYINLAIGIYNYLLYSECKTR